MKKEIKILDDNWNLTKKIDIFLTLDEYQNMANALEIIKEVSKQPTNKEKYRSFVITNKGQAVTKNPEKKAWIKDKYGSLLKEEKNEN